MDDSRWFDLAQPQEGVVARRQLGDLGVRQSEIRRHLRVGRWAERTPTVLTTTTGPLSWEQRLWVAALHAGPGALIGGLTAAKVHGLRNWDRDDITVLVDDEQSFDHVDGVDFVRTRRPLGTWVDPTSELPLARIEPAILLFAGYEEHPRTAQGAISAVVQQRLSTPERLRECLDTMRPLRRARDFRQLLRDLAGGAQSMAEIDVGRACREFGLVPPKRQRPRLDRDGKQRFTDCEWDLPDGRTLVLEVDGGFHVEVIHYGDDLKRQRKLRTTRRIVVRCTAYEIRHEPDAVMEDLVALGVPLRREPQPRSQRVTTDTRLG
jgi:hypothetical protein